MIVPKPSFFPSPHTADPTGLVATTSSLDTGLLLDAYAHGIFPWSDDPVHWYSPDPRAIFLRDRIHLPRRLGKIMRHNRFRTTFDRAFDDVIRGCARAHQADGVWISSRFVQAYGELYRLGHAHSVEVWQDEVLVGGLYGVQLGGLFAGESMFHTVSNASKVAFAALVHCLDDVGILLLDAQVLNPHTQRLGAVLVHREDYLLLLEHAVRKPCPYQGQCWPHDLPQGFPGA